jgi:hypothetical protein
MFAQSFAEFGALNSLATQAEMLVYSARVWVRGAGPEGWLTMGGSALFMIWLWGRRP